MVIGQTSILYTKRLFNLVYLAQRFQVRTGGAFLFSRDIHKIFLLNERGFMRTFGLFESHRRPYVMQIEEISRENVGS